MDDQICCGKVMQPPFPAGGGPGLRIVLIYPVYHVMSTTLTIYICVDLEGAEGAAAPRFRFSKEFL